MLMQIDVHLDFEKKNTVQNSPEHGVHAISSEKFIFFFWEAHCSAR